jgi:hypothetical protein
MMDPREIGNPDAPRHGLSASCLDASRRVDALTRSRPAVDLDKAQAALLRALAKALQGE